MPANQRSGQVNASRLLREIWMSRGLSRIELSRRLELDKSTVTLLVNPMLELGLVEVLSQGISSPKGGRRPQALGIRGDFACYLGVEVLPSGVRVALVDLQGTLLDKKAIEIDLHGGDWVKALVPLVEELYSGYGKDYPLLGLGLALPGVVNSADGDLHTSILLKVDRILALGNIMRKHIPCDIMVENDANCCTWGELVDHRFQAMEDFLFLLVESDLFSKKRAHNSRLSLGMGMAIDGKVYHGRDNAAGEFRSILWKGERESQFSLSLGELEQLSESKELRERLFHEISMNAALMINTLSLGDIFVGGDIHPYWEEFKPILDEEIRKNGSFQGRQLCQSHLSSKGEYAAAYGAAAMHLPRVFAGDMASFFQQRSQKIGLEALYIK